METADEMMHTHTKDGKNKINACPDALVYRHLKRRQNL
jgi:hypothetical protein